MSKQIEVVVREDGSVQVTTRGYVGNDCRKATESLERALGIKTSDRPTAEALNAAVSTVKQ